MHDRQVTQSNNYELQNENRHAGTRQKHVKRSQSVKHSGDSYEVSDEDTENINIQQTRRKETTGSSKLRSKPLSTQSSEANESPMAWFYDKIIGGNTTSAAESLATNKHSNHNKAPSYQRNSSAKRTMRV
jgi:hypothetical protein